ncbi:hypothetical protein AMK17_19700 [Streptomyces sp. CB00072]|nr:hypothetical protein AMK17_19700 [Streptomyces sp. CB00072]
MFAEPVDLTGAVVDQVGAAPDQNLEVDGYLVARPEQAEVLAHAGLVGDVEGVLGVRLALAPVGGRRLVNSKAGEIDHRLIVAEQQTDEQGGSAVADVHRPQRVPERASTSLISSSSAVSSFRIRRDTRRSPCASTTTQW